MKLVQDFIESAPVEKRLEFGYTNNIILSHVDTSIKKENNVIKRKQIELTLAEIDPDTGKIKAASTGSYWRLTNDEHFISGYLQLVSSLITVANALGVDQNKFYSEALRAIPDDVTNVKAWLPTKHTDVEVEDLQGSIANAVEKFFVPAVTKKTQLKMKVIINNKGFFELGNTEDWILAADSDRKLSEYTSGEVANYKESLTAQKSKVKPDATGSSPKGEKPVTGSPELM